MQLCVKTSQCIYGGFRVAHPASAVPTAVAAVCGQPLLNPAKQLGLAWAEDRNALPWQQLEAITEDAPVLQR